MKGKKIIIIPIIINILTIGIIYNLIKKDYLNNQKIIIKTMTEGEYEDSITSLNTSHEDYANYIEESKKKIASAITDMGVSTSNEASLEIMSNNIKSIARDASSISYDNTSSELVATNVQGAVDEINDSLKWKYIYVNEEIKEGYSYTLPTEAISANEIEIYCGILTVNASKHWEPVLPGEAVGFCYGGDRGSNYYVEVALYLAHNKTKIIVSNEVVSGWNSGVMQLFIIRYR